MSTNQHQNNNEKKNVVLNMQSKDREDQQVALNNKKSVIGSDIGCNVVMAAQSVKPVHCMVIQGEAGTIVRNFCSDTRLNGNPVGDTWFHADDTLSIGGVNLRFDQQSTPKVADTTEIEDRSAEIIELVDRLSQLESQLGELKASNEEFERRACDVENQLSQKLNEVSNLEDQNHQLTIQLGSVQRDLSFAAEHDAAKEKAAELESALESKNEIIEQFAERNCNLAREVNELRDQVINNPNLQSPPAHTPDQAPSENPVESASEATGSVDNNAETNELPGTPTFWQDETAEDTTALENTPATDETFAVETEPTDSAVEEAVFELESAQTVQTDESRTDPSFENDEAPQNEIETEIQNIAQEETQAVDEPAIANEFEPTDSTDLVAEMETGDTSDCNALEAETVEDAPFETKGDASTHKELEEYGILENVAETGSVLPEETVAENNTTSPAPIDPFKVLELIDSARSNEIERLDADAESSTEPPFATAVEPTLENVEPEISAIEPTAANDQAEEQDDNSDSWEANFRKEFRDELANKAASFCPDKNEVDEEKREEIASNIAQVESNLADLFRPREEDQSGRTTEGIRADENNTVKEAVGTPVESEMANYETPLTEDDPLKSPASEEAETTSEETGEIEFNFDLAESNLAGAFSDLSMEQEEGHEFGHENNEEIALDYTESTDEAVGDDPYELRVDSSESITTESESDVSEPTDHTHSSTETFGEEASAESSSDEFSQEQADDFFQAAMEAENANPYASFLNESEDDADQETDADQSSTLGQLEALGLKFGEETEPASDAAESSELETGSFSELYSQEQQQETESNSTGLSTAHLYQDIESGEDSEQGTVQTAESNQPLQPLNETAATSRPGDDESDDSYIQEYMKRLLGSDEEVASEAAPADVEEAKPQAPSLLEKTFEREIKERQEMLKPSEFIPKTSAPEKSSNLQAMRDLANQSARSAIETSTRKRKFEQQSTLILVLAGICFFVGASLAMLSASPISLTGMGSVLFFSLTGIGAWYYFDLKNSQSKSPNVDEKKAESPQTVDAANTPTNNTEA